MSEINKSKAKAMKEAEIEIMKQKNVALQTNLLKAQQSALANTTESELNKSTKTNKKVTKSLMEEVKDASNMGGERAKIVSFTKVGTRKQYYSLEQLKDEFKRVAKINKNLTQQEIQDAIVHLAIDDNTMDELYDWFGKNDIDIVDDALDDLMDEDDDLDDELMDDVFDDINSEIDLDHQKAKLKQYQAGREESSEATQARLNDGVKMYLKEIGRVPLLKAKDELEIAQRIDNGEIARKFLDHEELSEEEVEKLTTAVTNVDLNAEVQSDEVKKALARLIMDGQDAKQELIAANLRLVVSIAKKYVGRGMLFLDLIQEGNMGLVKAVEKFDYTKGFKFSTYATWWIRQAITRAIADQARTIRIPVHMVETINKLTRIQRSLVQKLGRDPLPAEIAAEMEGITPEKVVEIQRIALEPVSLETPVGEEDDSHLGDFIEDKEAMSPEAYANTKLLRNEINDVLAGLTEREEKVLRLRFGLDDGRTRTLEEVGREFNVTRERIRQIEAKALRKLKHPSRSKRLRDFVDKENG